LGFSHKLSTIIYFSCQQMQQELTMGCKRRQG
jgi:hypothetical protein